MPNGGHETDTAREAYPIAEISAIGEVQRQLGDNLSMLAQVLAIAMKPDAVEPEERKVEQEKFGAPEAGRSILYTQLCGVRSTAEALNRSVLNLMERLDF